jgi:hypothetical protein
MQWALLDREHTDQSDAEADGRGDEHQLQSRRGLAAAGGKFAQQDDAGSVAGAAEHDGAEGDNDDRPAEQAEEISVCR